MSNRDQDRGVLFINRNKNTQSHPDYSGTITINYQDYWISGWINTASKGVRKGEKYISFVIGDVKEPQPQPGNNRGYHNASPNQNGGNRPGKSQPVMDNEYYNNPGDEIWPT